MCAQHWHKASETGLETTRLTIYGFLQPSICGTELIYVWYVVGIALLLRSQRASRLQVHIPPHWEVTNSGYHLVKTPVAPVEWICSSQSSSSRVSPQLAAPGRRQRPKTDRLSENELVSHSWAKSRHIHVSCTARWAGEIFDASYCLFYELSLQHFS